MFKFLFGKKDAAPEIVIKETQRETITRALGEVNEVLAGLNIKPKMTMDLEIGLLEIELPEQMPDEALALPSPKEAKPKAADAPKAGAAKAEAPKTAATKAGTASDSKTTG